MSEWADIDLFYFKSVDQAWFKKGGIRRRGGKRNVSPRWKTHPFSGKYMCSKEMVLCGQESYGREKGSRIHSAPHPISKHLKLFQEMGMNLTSQCTFIQPNPCHAWSIFQPEIWPEELWKGAAKFDSLCLFLSFYFFLSHRSVAEVIPAGWPLPVTRVGDDWWQKRGLSDRGHVQLQWIFLEASPCPQMPHIPLHRTSFSSNFSSKGRGTNELEY